MNEKNEGIVSISPNGEYVAFYYLNLLENNSIIDIFNLDNLLEPINTFKYPKTNIYSISWCADNQYFLFINNNKLFLSDLRHSYEIRLDYLNNKNILLKTVVFHPIDRNIFILGHNNGELFFFYFLIEEKKLIENKSIEENKLIEENKFVFVFGIMYSFSFLDKSSILASIFSNNSEHIALINSNSIITKINVSNINYNINSYSSNHKYKEINNQNTSKKIATLNNNNILLCYHLNREIPSCILNITRNRQKNKIKSGNLQINTSGIQITHLYISDNKPIFKKINQVNIPSENIIIDFVNSINSRNSLINIPVISWSPNSNFIVVSINNSLIIKNIEEENKQIKLNFKCNISVLWHPTINNIICCFSNSIIYIIKLINLENNYNIHYEIIKTIERKISKKKISNNKNINTKIISVSWIKDNFLIIGYSDGNLEKIYISKDLLIKNSPTTRNQKIENFVKKEGANKLRTIILGPKKTVHELTKK